jgi:uncharacterized UBP type Zn finger protein
MSANQCTHLDTIEITELPDEVSGCAECLEMDSPWCHLRICLACGHVGCCDSSPNHHATTHARESGHVLVRSIQPGESWAWCYADQAMLPTVPVSGQPQIPPSPLCP